MISCSFAKGKKEKKQKKERKRKRKKLKRKKIMYSLENADIILDAKYYLTHNETKCEKPIILKNGQKVSCGYCPLCIDKKRKDWTLRNKIELSQNKLAMFVTLTFDNEHLKDTSYYQIQRFLKRLRKYLLVNQGNKKGIKYFGCYENGEKTGRPHYHLIIYGDYLQPRYIKNKKVETSNEIMGRIWGNGFADVKPAIPENISYITKYIMKQERPNNIFNLKCYNQYNKYDTNHIHRESFIFMSKGLGFTWLSNNIQMVHEKNYITSQGYKLAIPKGFKEKIKQTLTLENDGETLVNTIFEKYIDKHPTDIIDAQYIANYEEWFYNQMKAKANNIKKRSDIL